MTLELSPTPDWMPDGEALPCQTPPRLTPAHTTRLRKLWGYGRPVHVSELSGIDLDLVAHGYAETVDRKYNAGPVLAVTKRGVAYMSDVRQAQIATQRPHHELGQRLATYLRDKGFFTWENVEFSNPDPLSWRTWGSVRPDVYACLPSLKSANAAPAIYEVKVSRADFLADLAKPTKRQAYADLAEAVYYCCPDGLLSKAEIPDGFGLLCETDPGHFELRKRARRAKGFQLHIDIALTLMVKRQVPIGEIE